MNEFKWIEMTQDKKNLSKLVKSDNKFELITNDLRNWHEAESSEEFLEWSKGKTVRRYFCFIKNA